MDYYNLTNIEKIITYNDFWLIDIEIKQTKIITIYINAKVLGKIGIDFEYGISYYESNNKWIEFIIEKECAKKQYDGTIIFTLDVSNMDTHVLIEGQTFLGYDFIIINNITAVFEGKFPYFEYNLYKNAISNEIEK